MKFLAERTEVAKAINGRKCAVVTIDLAKADDYGLVSEPVVIDNGTFDDGFPYMIHSEIRCYCDERKFTFSSGGFGIHSSFGYSDVMEMLKYRNAPVIKADSDVILVIKDSKNEKCWIRVMHTAKKIAKFCSTPLTFIEEDDYDFNTGLLARAGCELRERV